MSAYDFCEYSKVRQMVRDEDGMAPLFYKSWIYAVLWDLQKLLSATYLVCMECQSKKQLVFDVVKAKNVYYVLYRGSETSCGGYKTGLKCPILRNQVFNTYYCVSGCVVEAFLTLILLILKNLVRWGLLSLLCKGENQSLELSNLPQVRVAQDWSLSCFRAHVH